MNKLTSLKPVEILTPESINAIERTIKFLQAKQQKKKEALTPIHPKWNDAVNFLKGSGTMTKILESYEVSKEFQDKLINETLK